MDAALDLGSDVASEGDATDDDGDGFDEVMIEFTNLDLIGFSPLLGPVSITLNPSIASTGEIVEQVNNNSGLLDISPFTATGSADISFDLYF